MPCPDRRGAGRAPAAPIPTQVVWRARTAAEAAPWNELRAIQSATLRWCAARGDVLAVLALPPVFTADDALRHVRVLRGATPSFDDTGCVSPPASGGVPALDRRRGAASLGYGALYHPWPVVGRRRRHRRSAPVPPDGAVAGTYAARSLRPRRVDRSRATSPLDTCSRSPPPSMTTGCPSLAAAGVNPRRRRPVRLHGADRRDDDRRSRRPPGQRAPPDHAAAPAGSPRRCRHRVRAQRPRAAAARPNALRAAAHRHVPARRVRRCRARRGVRGLHRRRRQPADVGRRRPLRGRGPVRAVAAARVHHRPARAGRLGAGRGRGRDPPDVQLPDPHRYRRTAARSARRRSPSAPGLEMSAAAQDDPRGRQQRRPGPPRRSGVLRHARPSSAV